MSERPPRKSGLSPSPVSLALLIVILAVVAIGAITLLTTGITAPPSIQTGAMANSNQTQNKQSNPQNALAAATATALDDEDPNYATRVVPLPTDAELPPGLKTSTPLPPLTEITYTPRPTANLEKVAPIEEWKEYVNEQQGFTIKYPPDWYLKTGATGQTTQLYNYDFNDPTLTGYKGPPLNLTGIDIYARRGELSEVYPKSWTDWIKNIIQPRSTRNEKPTYVYTGIQKRPRPRRAHG